MEFKRLIAFTLALILPAAALADHLPPLHVGGSHLVDPSGRPVALKGCNLGNWFMIEPWMLGGCIEATDQYQIFATFHQRFGQAGGDHLINLYRAGYVTPRDFEMIKSFGFNLVRLPFDYRMVQDDTPPYPIKTDAFVWLDRAVSMADAAGVYIILDLHGAPGGQSLEMHTGKAGVNQLFTKPENPDRTVAIWHALSKHFRDRSAVAAYDLLNEPYGDHHTNMKPGLLKLMPRLYETIRATGDNHVVFFPGTLNTTIAFYGDPHSHGWTNVAFTEHNYAGLFGKERPSLEGHAYVLNQTFPQRKAYTDQIGVPYYLGEFNTVEHAAGGEWMMRRYYDRAAEYGWPLTMWSYKLIKPNGGAGGDVWYMVTNADDLPILDLHDSSYADFEAFFTNLATMELAVNEPLRNALTTAHPKRIPLYGDEQPQTKPSNALVYQATPSDLSGYGFRHEVNAVAGARYALKVRVARTSANGNDARIELRIESTFDGHPVVVNAQTFVLPAKTPENVWTLNGTAPGPKLRIVVNLIPARRAGVKEIQLKDVQLTQM
jgi:endoglucanase